MKYIKNQIQGGVGAQIKTLETLIPLAEKLDMQVIFDVRTFSYFKGPEASSYLNDEKLDQLLEFHPRLIYNSELIDSITPNAESRKRKNQFTGVKDYKEVFDLDRWSSKRQVFDWLFNDSMAGGAWKKMIDNPNRANEPASYSYPTQLPIRIKDRALIEKYESRIRNSVAVHARLGNGEVEKFKARWALKKLPDTLARMGISPDMFIDEMKKYDEDFFVCTDTFAFVEKCKDSFGNRVFHTDRSWTPEGIGPGHRNIRTDDSEPPNPNRWDNFYEAVMEMELLSKSKHLICNKSEFNVFARQNSPSTLIKPI